MRSGQGILIKVINSILIFLTHSEVGTFLVTDFVINASVSTCFFFLSKMSGVFTVDLHKIINTLSSKSFECHR